jgi:DNA-binding response OmpR family regulator
VSIQVLIADGDQKRAQRIAEACRASGLSCQVTSHGAAALETALSELPAVLVAQLDLPLIDGPKLAAILKANPRTQPTRILFVSERAEAAARKDLPGRLIAAPVDPDEVASAARGLLGNAASAAAMVTPLGAASSAVEGDLAQITLADLLELFQVSRETGIFELAREAEQGRRVQGQIALRGGEVVGARIDAAHGEKALFRLLAWERGAFAFRPGPVNEPGSIQRPTRALLREAKRQREEWERLSAELPPLSAHVTLRIQRAALPNVIHPLTQEVLVILEHYSRVQDVVDRCSYPDYQVLRTLHTLIRRGMLELRRAPDPAPAALPETRLFSPARVARLREWAETGRPRGAPPRDAKLLVVASDPGATADFVRMLARQPGVAIDERFGKGAYAADDLVRMGRIAVEDGLGIELWHIPIADRFAPIWPTLGHGALGSLFLLTGPASRAVEGVRGALTALRRLPRARIFSLLLLEKGERVVPEELRENFALLDQGSLFLIPLESSEKSGMLLREMLQRVLP